MVEGKQLRRTGLAVLSIAAVSLAVCVAKTCRYPPAEEPLSREETLSQSDPTKEARSVRHTKTANNTAPVSYEKNDDRSGRKLLRKLSRHLGGLPSECPISGEQWIPESPELIRYPFYVSMGKPYMLPIKEVPTHLLRLAEESDTEHIINALSLFEESGVLVDDALFGAMPISEVYLDSAFTDFSGNGTYEYSCVQASIASSYIYGWMMDILSERVISLANEGGCEARVREIMLSIPSISRELFTKYLTMVLFGNSDLFSVETAASLINCLEQSSLDSFMYHLRCYSFANRSYRENIRGLAMCSQEGRCTLDSTILTQLLDMGSIGGF